MLQIHHQNARNIYCFGVRVYVTDLERAYRWYSQVLGLKLTMAPDRQSARHAVQYEEGVDVPIFWLVPGLAASGHHTEVSLTFQVSNLEQTIAELKSAGVTVAREPSIELGSAMRSATILDPDGHGLVIYQS
jgi:predicted enzyme related to lactoylglutathione lyase